MAGYCDYSKSNNAIQDEERGYMTAHKMAKWVAKISKRFRGCNANDIKNVFTPVSWHHTSCHYNMTDYFDPEHLFESRNRAKLYFQIKNRKGSQIEVYNNCSIVWFEWSGTRRFPKVEKYKAENVTITRKPGQQFLTITGGTLPNWTSGSLKKKIGCRGLEIRDENGKLIF